MADYPFSLPVRTEAAGDVAAKICDGNTPSQQLAVSASGEASVQITQPIPAGTNNIGDVDVLSQPARDHATDSIKVGDGTDFLAVNNDGSINAVVSATDLDIRDLTHVSDSVKVGDGTDLLEVNADGSINAVVSATDLDIRDLSASQDSVAAHLFDEAGVAFSNANPLPVAISLSDGDPIHDYNTAASLAGGGTSNHDYTVTGGKTLFVKQIVAAGSGKMKIEIQEETAAASGTYNTIAVFFNSTANPNMYFQPEQPLEVEAGKKIRIIRTNRDNQAQDVYSTIIGAEF